MQMRIAYRIILSLSKLLNIQLHLLHKYHFFFKGEEEGEQLKHRISCGFSIILEPLIVSIFLILYNIKKN